MGSNSLKSYETFGWVSNQSLVGKTITFDYDGRVITASVWQRILRGEVQMGGYCSFRHNGRTVGKCPLKLLSGLGLEGEEKNRAVLYHPERNIYSFVMNICIVTGNVVKNKNFTIKGKRNKNYFYDKNAVIAYEKACRVSSNQPDKGNKEIVTAELAREIYNSKDEDGNYRCHVSGEVMDLKDLNADHCHCTGKYMGLVTPEVNTMEGQLKKALDRKGLKFTHEERLDLIRGMFQGAEKMHNKRLMKVWENTVTSKEQKKTSTQQSTPMQLSLAL